MRYRRILLLAGCLAAGGVVAQTPPTTRSDWAVQPLASHSSDYRSGTLSVPGDSKSSPFRFSNGREGGVLDKPPPLATDRDVVLGTGRPWMGGRPPLDCAMTPLDARCR